VAAKTTLGLWIASRLTAVALAIGAISTLSYATGASIAVRFLAPQAGAWWQGHEYWFMEGSASALGWLIGVRIAARTIDDTALRNRVAGFSIVLGALALAWIAPACAVLARMGWGAQSLEDVFVGRFGYGAGLLLDKVLIAGVYFLKTAGFAMLLGLAGFGVILSVFLAAGSAGSAREAVG
jgi:hypothetical protein